MEFDISGEHNSNNYGLWCANNCSNIHGVQKKHNNNKSKCL